MATTKPIPQQSQLLDGGFRLGDFEYIRSAIINLNSAGSTYGIVAAGTTQATATQLGSAFNQVDTTASGTGVNLPLSTGKHSTPSQNCLVVNNGANALQVYGYQGSSDTINGVAAGTGVTIAAGGTVWFASVKGGAWFSIGSVDADTSSLRGTFTALTGGGPVTVANANITANSVVVFTLKTVGGTVGAYPTIQTITPGTGFTVDNTSGDTSVYNYLIIG